MDNENVLQGIFFQDNEMKHSFSCYPELLCIDATYKLLELRFPLFLMLIEDGNGQSIIVASFLALNETEATFSKMVALPQGESVTVIMADKDLTECTVLAEQFPSAQLLICFFHTLQSFRQEITQEKMGITAGKRIYCLATNGITKDTDEYMELYNDFQRNAPSIVFDYFNEQWHSIRDQWTLGAKCAAGNFFCNTNNRIISTNAKIKSVISSTHHWKNLWTISF